MPRPLRDVRPAELAAALPGALDGSGPAVRVLGRDRAAKTGDVVPDGVAVVLRTSGSTGEPREVMLTADALAASGTATHRRLGGAGHWLLALPVDHVAGLQVCARSLLAGTRAVALGDGPFRPEPFVAAAALVGTPAYTSLVPTQLARLLDDGPGTAALARFDAVLVGGAALAAPLAVRARAAGVRLVPTYGSTETCGGAVYDGRPLAGVQVQVGADGRVRVGGAVLAHGYRGRPDLDAAAFVVQDDRRWFVTSDLGELSADGRLTLLGRADDVLVSGGVNVAPAAVEAVLARVPGVREVLVVGVADDDWGQAVVALVVPARTGAPALADLRDAARAALGPAAAPRSLVVVDALPVRGPGKPDRRAAAALAGRELSREVVAGGYGG